jgi:hypothetical protein
MRAKVISAVALCSLGASGCHSVYSVHPLNTSEDAVQEPALVGEWKSSSNGDDRFCIREGDRNTYTLLISESDSNSEGEPKPGEEAKAPELLETYQIALVRLDNQLFADMAATGQSMDGKEIEAPIGAVHHHIIIKLDLSETELRYSLLDTGTIREANEQGYAPLSYVEIGDDLLLAASTEELRWAASHYADRLFRESEAHYIHVTDDSSSPCGAVPSP